MTDWEELTAKLAAAQETLEAAAHEMKAKDDFEVAARQADLLFRKLQVETMRCDLERVELYRRETEGVEKYRADMLQVYREGFALIAAALKERS